MNPAHTSPTVLVNGAPQPLPDASTTLDALLRQTGLDVQTSGIAVALNDEVVRRQAWPETTIHEGDHIEVVTAKQGG